jgi:hypothetical protein
VSKIRQLELPEEARNVFLVVTFLLIIDFLVAVVTASGRGTIVTLPYDIRGTKDYMRPVVTAFGRGTIVTLSNLLFLEGAIILPIGIFIAVAIAWQKTNPQSETTTETTDNVEQTQEKRLNIGVLMIIIGAILIGLSITVGTLFL